MMISHPKTHIDYYCSHVDEIKHKAKNKYPVQSYSLRYLQAFSYNSTDITDKDKDFKHNAFSLGCSGGIRFMNGDRP